MNVVKCSVLCLVVVFGGTNGCYSQTSGQASAKIETRTPGGFSSLENNGAFNVHVEQGPEYTVRIETEPDFLPYVRTMVNDSVLFINVPEASIRKLKKTEIYITLPELRRVRNTGAGRLEVKEFTGTMLRIENAGSGSMKLNIHYQKVDCRNAGAGGIVLSGTSEEANYYNRGVGKISALEINPAKVYVENDGTGGVNVSSFKELSIVNRGIGTVRYLGEATPREINNQGIGSVKRMK